MSILRARHLRRNATDAERKLWSDLRQLRSEGIHFRRQVPIGPYFADFACHHARLVVELDGHQHGFSKARAHDARRDAIIRSHGYDVIRFHNGDVYENLDGVVEAILDALKQRPLTPRKMITETRKSQS